MTEKLSDQSLNLKTNFMRTRNYLLIICLFLTFCQGCVKELHELPPRPSLVVKLNGVEKDSIIVAPGDEVKIDIDFIANQGFIQELYVTVILIAWTALFVLWYLCKLPLGL